MLSVSRLRVLKEVAYRGSLSAVSQQIAALEAEAGMALLERHPRGVSLTAAGQTLVGHAEGILAQLEAAEASLSAISGLRGGVLRIASFPTAGATLMPLAIATFRSAYPAVQLSLTEGEPPEIARRLGAGELDLALLFEFAEPTQLPGELTRVELVRDPMYLALPREHALAGKDRLRLEDLRGEAWVQTSAASPCARHVVRCCHAAGFEPKVSFESDDYQTVQGLVAAGVGVALIPELALSVVRDDIAIRALSPRPPLRQVIAALPAGARLVPAAPAMLGILEEAARRYERERRPAAERRSDAVA